MAMQYRAWSIELPLNYIFVVLDVIPASVIRVQIRMVVWVGALIFCWYSVDILLIFCWYSVDILLIFCWYSAVFRLIFCWYSADILLVFCWYSVDILLIFCWYSVDILLIFWGLFLTLFKGESDFCWQHIWTLAGLKSHVKLISVGGGRRQEEHGTADSVNQQEKSNGFTLSPNRFTLSLLTVSLSLSPNRCYYLNILKNVQISFSTQTSF